MQEYQKKQAKKTRLGDLALLSNFLSPGLNLITISFISICLIILSFISFSFFASSIFSLNANATEASVDTRIVLGVNSVINISAPSSAALTCEPGISATTTSMCTTGTDITVGTNNITGYTLQMNASNGYSNALTNTATTPSSTIPTLDNAYPVATPASFPVNTWGYTGGMDKSSETGGYNCTNDPTNGNYCPVSAYQSDSTNYAPNRTIKETTAPATASITSLTFGSKVDVSKPSGTYTTSVTFTAIANFIPAPITDGLAMQDVDHNNCRMTPQYSQSGTIYTLFDERDHTPYSVARLEDGNCWMTQNLELGEYGTPMNLTDQLSNVSSAGYTLSLPYANNSVYKHNSNHYGNFYNWNTATAGSGTSIVGEDAPYSICPANWRLPSASSTGATDSEFYAMLNNYISTGTWVDDGNSHWTGVVASQYTNMPTSLVFSGYIYSSGTLYGQGSIGSWWSATSNGSTNAFYMDASTGGYVTPRDHNGRSNGFSVRCLVSGT